MMKSLIRRRALWIAVMAALIAATALGDVIVTRDGMEIVGRVVEEDYQTITLRTADGDLVFNRSDITEVRRPFSRSGDLLNPLPVDPSATLPPPGQPLTVAQATVVTAEAVTTEAPVEETVQELRNPQIFPNSAGVVFSLEGDMRINRAGNWMDAQVGMQLRVSDQLQTGRGRSKVLLQGRGEVRLPPNSHLELVALERSGEQTNVTLRLVRGSVWVDVEPPDTGGVNFNVQTPDLTAGVRGTLFHLIHQEASGEIQSGTRLSVYRGLVEAISNVDPSQTANVPANMFVFCGEDGRLTAPEPIRYNLEQQWNEWDDWALESHMNLTVPFAAGGNVIGGMIETTAAEQQLHATMVAEHAANTNLNRQGDFLATLAEGFVAYARDVRDLPPSTEPFGADGWRALVENPGVPNWRGPYIGPGVGPADVPVQDGWGRPITYRRQQSQVSGNVFGELISNGPNGIFSQGQADDLRQLIVLPGDIQAELRGR